MAQITKKALAASLKNLLAQKTLDKITVIDIVKDCEVNRQTFYYHFHDIYDLVEWTFLNEATRALGPDKTYETWQQGFLKIFGYALENKTLIKNIYHSAGRGHLTQYLYRETGHLLMDVVRGKAEGLPVREDEMAFIADFYKYAFAGILLEWIRDGMMQEPADAIEKLSVLIQGNMEAALERYSAGR
ncbi:MAG: TetR/AcrR family transcriptional regulator [Clostridiales Family XIII bacterium]|nr:TetR/AcrR family transcriptional regulator [Clostridiales Family XIII bacterium]